MRRPKKDPTALENQPRKHLIAEVKRMTARVENLAERLAESGGLQEALGKSVNELADKARDAERRLEGSRTDFADLKARLLSAELANERLRGYLDRVREDDVVREVLVETGDPEGEKLLTPKRKHADMPRPDHYLRPHGADLSRDRAMGMMQEARGWAESDGRKREPLRNWVSY